MPLKYQPKWPFHIRHAFVTNCLIFNAKYNNRYGHQLLFKYWCKETSSSYLLGEQRTDTGAKWAVTEAMPLVITPRGEYEFSWESRNWARSLWIDSLFTEVSILSELKQGDGGSGLSRGCTFSQYIFRPSALTLLSAQSLQCLMPTTPPASPCFDPPESRTRAGSDSQVHLPHRYLPQLWQWHLRESPAESMGPSQHLSRLQLPDIARSTESRPPDIQNLNLRIRSKNGVSGNLIGPNNSNSSKNEPSALLQSPLN